MAVDTVEASIQAPRKLLDTDLTWRQAMRSIIAAPVGPGGALRCPIPASSNSRYLPAAIAG